jgi:hypothetical protein
MLTFLNIALLAGLGVIVVPPLVHLFSRRRIDEIDWAAMQFLSVSLKTRRKVSFENLLLMLLRMAALALLAFAMAGPVVTTTLFSKLGLGAGERDIVILLDGSGSMAWRQGNASTSDAARQWIDSFLGTLRPGDRVCLFEARQALRPLQGTLSSEVESTRNALELVAAPSGGVDWPGCVQAALVMLENGRSERDVVIVSDNQRWTWADNATLARWDLVTGRGRAGRPRVWVANVAGNRPAEPFNLSLEPIVAARGVASAQREVRFRSALHSSGKGEAKVASVKLEIDGQPTGEVPVEGTATDAVRAITFTHKFAAGSHLVSLIAPSDDFPLDNKQDFALEVLPAVPVLIVDGAGDRRSEFLRDALAPAKDPNPAFLTKTISITHFSTANLAQDVKGTGTPPRVVVLANVPALTAAQNTAVEDYLSKGGAVLMLAGDKCDAATWNRVSFRAGQGWLPARLGESVSSSKPDDTRPMLASFVHPAVEVFRDPLPGGLHTAIFPTKWKLDAAAGVNGATGTIIARCNDGDALVVERGVGRGRACVAAVALDNSGGTNLHTLPDFVRVSHELLYYLAGARSAERNLSPGQPIVFSPVPAEAVWNVTVSPPAAPPMSMPVKAWPLTFAATHDAGAYKLTTGSGRVFWYAVKGDARESVLTPNSKEDAEKVAAAVQGLTYIEDASEMTRIAQDAPVPRDFWWLAMFGVLCLFAGELLFARKLSRGVEE